MPILVKNISYSYNNGITISLKALNDISISINENEYIAIIGHTGSGKSTFVQHLNGLIYPDKGSILVDDIEICNDKNKLSEIRKKVGIVFQYPENQLFEDTVFKDIAFGPKNQGLNTAQIEKRVVESMKLVGLEYEEFKDKSPFELSGGEMRRVAIAGVIALKPKYLILDEPTAGLDPMGKKQILEMISKIHRDMGNTVIMISHSMDEVFDYASRVIVFDSGKIICDGTMEYVFSNYELLKNVGLDLPYTLNLKKKLIENGLNIKDKFYKFEDLKKEILEIYKGKK